MKQYVSIVIVTLLLANNVAFFGVNGDTSVERAAALGAASDSAVARYQAGVDEGIYLSIPNNASLHTDLITLPGNLKLTAGLVTLPVDFLCRQEDTSIIKIATCHICSYDCTYVHNKFGGQCGVVTSNPVPGTPQADGPVCVCNDVAPPNVRNITDVETQCGSLVDPLADEGLDLAIAVALRKRMMLVQCIPDGIIGSPLFGSVDGAGCKTDCTTNHNYVDGRCQTILNPVASVPLDLTTNIRCPCTH